MFAYSWFFVSVSSSLPLSTLESILKKHLRVFKPASSSFSFDSSSNKWSFSFQIAFFKSPLPSWNSFSRTSWSFSYYGRFCLERWADLSGVTRGTSSTSSFYLVGVGFFSLSFDSFTSITSNYSTRFSAGLPKSGLIFIASSSVYFFWSCHVTEVIVAVCVTSGS
jgi:hypothetical protein